MSWYQTEIVVFADGALENIEKYSGAYKGESFDRGFIKSRYVIGGIGRIPAAWHEYLEKYVKMDYGSDLYVCGKKELQKMIRLNNITEVYDELWDDFDKDGKVVTHKHKIPIGDILDRGVYGILEIEIF
ncbi:MAG: hypothetical protein K6E85_07325 [Lachnospiraceae bacterium]|nr:hypothetical protein [Lachnospiraceae bacterium]